VNTLLDFSRIEAGRVEASYEPTNLGGLTSELASMFRSAIDRAGLALGLDLAPIEEPAYVDRDMWEKIVLNLLSNALKFTFDGEIAISLRVCYDSEMVARYGHRHRRRELPQVSIGFTNWARLYSRRHRDRIGTCRRTDRWSGRVRVESTEGQGTAFSSGAARPQAPARSDWCHTDAAIDHDRCRTACRGGISLDGATTERQNARRRTDRKATPHARRARIILADDNADMRDYVCRLLHERWDVEAVPDGETALAMIKRLLPIS
jgi:CheY-like chemotaxis protein